MVSWSALFFLLLAIAAGFACLKVGGPELLESSAVDAVWQLLDFVPELTMGLLIAGFSSVLLPRERIARALGGQSGFRGILLATAIGSFMPGGPFASFPLVFALSQAGADIGALIAFLVAWATIGINRLVVWEIPLMGMKFGILRLACSIPLPILAGLLARWLTVRFPLLRVERTDD
ncbi:permease [Propylenella binzhouense]|uniref:Permease n=1 Tax=Propylenella binzhouense TaxID=2555902 RepID=A0A964T4I5_9HYPH|nr:permease [Propylenella binzhouense]MYZ48189.1 hypothetical protein [Propylenella binzhouense]